MTLSVRGCVRLWQSAQDKRPAPWEGRHNCLSCPLGAIHAGQPAELAAASRAAEALRKICPRCVRPTTRLVNGAFCVSCYNRHREVARGKNCKGNPPIVVQSRIHSVSILVARPSAPTPTTEVFPAVTSRVEAMILAAKKASGPIMFIAPPRETSINFPAQVAA